MRRRRHLFTSALAIATAHQDPNLTAQNQRFTLLMTKGAGETRTNLSLTAVQNGTSDVLLLVGDDPATCAGSPVYLNASLSNFEGSGGEYVALQLDVGGEAYGVGVPPIVSEPGAINGNTGSRERLRLQGDMHGVAYSVVADEGYSEYQFRVIDGQVYHRPSSGASVFLVCNRTIDGDIRPVLSWGSAPYVDGCWPTSVYQRCNVKSSSVKCS